MLYKKFILLKDFEYHGMVLKKGADIKILNNIIYVNEGQITPAYYNLFYDMINDEIHNKSNKIIKEVPIPYNKV